MEAQAEEWSAESQKEKKLRERSEQYSRQLEEELEGMKVCAHKHTFFFFPENKAVRREAMLQ